MMIDRSNVLEMSATVPASFFGEHCADAEGGHANNGAVRLQSASAEEVRLAEFLCAVERYRPRLIWVATRIINRGEDAEDIVQQALLNAFVNLSKFRGESQMATWLRAIVQNAAREYVRKQRGKAFVQLEYSTFPDGDCDENEIPDEGMSPEEHCERREREQMVATAFGGMSTPNRQVLELCVFEELPYIEVATALNLSVATVKSRMFRSRRDLRMAISTRIGAIN